MDAIALDSRLRHAADFLGQPAEMLIDGKLVSAASGKTFPVYNPATGTVIANVPEGDKEDVNRAVAAARTPLFHSALNVLIRHAAAGRHLWLEGFPKKGLEQRPSSQPSDSRLARCIRDRRARDLSQTKLGAACFPQNRQHGMRAWHHAC